MIGEVVLNRAQRPDLSIVAQAAKYDVPIYTSSPGDSSIGMNLSAAKMSGSTITVDPDLDVMETTAIVYASSKNGAIEIGGGSPKNFYLQTQPQLSQILGMDGGGQDFLIQITTSSPQWGGLSGATFQEAISWGKVNPREPRNNVVLYADATIAAPILFAYIMSTRKGKALKRLYAQRPKLVEELQRDYDKKDETRNVKMQLP
jgi:deoxyhypusine synthase